MKVLLLSIVLPCTLPLFAADSLFPDQEDALRAPWTANDSNTAPRELSESEWTGIREAHTEWRHRVQPADGGWQAQNPGQRWTTRFDGRGFLTTPQAAGWQWGLMLESYGFGEVQTKPSGQPKIAADGGRLTYRWDGRLEEWFVNDRRGLEHGFVLHKRPPGYRDGQPLEVRMTVRGGLRPGPSADGKAVHFHDGAGASVLNYGGLKVWDANGTVLPAGFALGAGGTVVLHVEETAACYPLTIDPIAQQAYLKASNTGSLDWFGWSVAVSGDTVVVGAPLESSSATGVNGDQTDDSFGFAGAAYVFVRSGSGWTQQAYLKASNTDSSDEFGHSVAVSGDTVVVGAPHESSNATGVNGNQTDESAGFSGAAYVFVRSGGTWTQQAYLKASNTEQSDEFGQSVAVSGNTAVVGAHFEDGSAGAAYVFTRGGSGWVQQAYLKASNKGADDRFGYSVSISGDTVVVGASREDSSATGVNGNQNDNSESNSGAAYVFVRNGAAWTQQAYLKASNAEAGDRFGWSVGASGDTVVVGAWGEDSDAPGVNGDQQSNFENDAGAAYVFVRNGTAWTQQAYLKASYPFEINQFGYSVAVSGDKVVVGSNFESSDATGVNGVETNTLAPGSGAAYVFSRTGATWAQQAYLKASNTGTDDDFGHTVAISEDTVIVGAWREDSVATGVNGSQANDSGEETGAAYIFTGFGVVSSTTLAQWRQTYFGTTANTGDAADGYDFDGDGRVNLLEWATGTHPKQPGVFQPALVRSGQNLEFTYTRSLAAFNAGAGYAVEWSETLAAGSWQSTGVTQSILSTVGDVQTVKATVATGTQRRWLRLRATAP